MKNHFDVLGKVALVTGGRRGIGKAICLGLAEQGAKVIAVGKSDSAEELLDEAFVSYGTTIEYIQCDLSDKLQRKHLIPKVFEKHGKIDVLINNAGDQNRGEFKSYDEATWNRDLELLLTVPFELSQEFFKNKRDDGLIRKIINIGSISSVQAAKNIVGYVSAKHGLIGLTKSMALEMAPFFTVNCLCPGFFETDLLRKFSFDEEKITRWMPMGRVARPTEIIGTILWLSSSSSDYVTGTTITIDGGWTCKNG